MQILQTSGWDDYELIDSGNGKRLERYGKYRLVRPDPQAIWQPMLPNTEWEKADAVFSGDLKKGQWVKKTAIPDSWEIQYKNLRFLARLTPFKHTGIFPEQSLNWEFMQEKIRAVSPDSLSLRERVRVRGSEEIASSPALRSPRNDKQPKILNLFGYTGAASVVCAQAGAEVTHVDASKPAITWARENQMASGLAEKPIRWILDDALKFTAREVKRGNRYEGIIMDPPIYGHGPEGEIWDFPKSFPQLLANCRAILSDKPLFVIVNAYAISASAIMLGNVMRDYFEDVKGNITVGELALQESQGKRLLSTGIYARWETL